MPREPELDEVEVIVTRDMPGEKCYTLTGRHGDALFPKSEVAFKRRNTKTGAAIAEIPVWLLKDRGWDKKPVDPLAGMPIEDEPESEWIRSHADGLPNREE